MPLPGQEAKRRVEEITSDIEVRHDLRGKVAKLMDFGALSPSCWP